jgi:hypothetical protein
LKSSEAAVALEAKRGLQVTLDVDRAILASVDLAGQTPSRFQGEAVRPFEMNFAGLQRLIDSETLRGDLADLYPEHWGFAQTYYFSPFP